MFLKKFIFVNWGNIPQLEFEMGPINLLSGGNGSGKTTAADAIQTIMTAAHENLFQYIRGRMKPPNGDAAVNGYALWHLTCWAVTMVVMRGPIRAMVILPLFFVPPKAKRGNPLPPLYWYACLAGCHRRTTGGPTG